MNLEKPKSLDLGSGKMTITFNQAATTGEAIELIKAFSWALFDDANRFKAKAAGKQVELEGNLGEILKLQDAVDGIKSNPELSKKVAQYQGRRVKE